MVHVKKEAGGYLVILQVALGDETHLADVALERLLTLVLYPDVLVNTGKRKREIIERLRQLKVPSKYGQAVFLILKLKCLIRLENDLF